MLILSHTIHKQIACFADIQKIFKNFDKMHTVNVQKGSFIGKSSALSSLKTL